MKNFKEFYNKRKKKKKIKPLIVKQNFTGNSNYVNQPPVGNPPNVGYTQSFGN